MFTGIIETTGIIKSVEQNGTGRSFQISSPISSHLREDQSVAHNGVCLTVEQVLGDAHRVTAVLETLSKTDLGSWTAGSYVNLERCMQMNGRLDGHIVQGHVDTTAACVSVIDQGGSWLYRFRFEPAFASLLIEKGSICVNGISLTCFDVTENEFSVAIIPYTYEHTNIHAIRQNDRVNLEFDVLGKYIRRHLELERSRSAG